MATGPVVLTEDNTYLFRNTGSTLDLYFSISKNELLNWQLADGPDYEIPKSYIKQLGCQIDYVNTDSSTIEVMADGILSNLAAKESNEKEIQFEFLMSGLNLRVYYQKELNKEGKAFWQYKGNHLITE